MLLNRFRAWYMPKTPYHLRVSIDKHGIWFMWNGDEVCWTWPWRRRGTALKYISVGFTGTGAFGDARFSSLKELDEAWDSYFEAEAKLAQLDTELATPGSKA